MNRLLVGLLAISAAAAWLLTGSNLHSAPQQKSSAPQFLEGDAYQKARAFSPAVITRGGRIIWLAGQTATQDLNGKSLLGDFQGQAKNRIRTHRPHFEARWSEPEERGEHDRLHQ